METLKYMYINANINLSLHEIERECSCKGALLPKMCGIVPYGPLKNFSRPHIHSLRTKREPKMKRNLLKKKKTG